MTPEDTERTIARLHAGETVKVRAVAAGEFEIVPKELHGLRFYKYPGKRSAIRLSDDQLRNWLSHLELP